MRGSLGWPPAVQVASGAIAGARPEIMRVDEDASVCPQLQSIYHEAFSSFQGVGDLLFRPDSAAVNASLVFEGPAPGPSACEVLWTLYRKVKAAGKMLGNLSLDESSLASDGSNLTDLALETISIRLTAMRPFQPPLLLPGSAPFVLLEKTILRQVTPVVSGFYTAHPQEDPLLLFRLGQSPGLEHNGSCCPEIQHHGQWC
ncbi:taste receptor cell protein 1-like [Balaenoptera ricei]|uniref:taste receptor cell protein 1-like n=1 Tax=Balaenoptera ricei TaxID=2746895 RepID=UPI0028BD9480|nr:taste receptor cell protein 1-like [Balaenoptera ricei]